MVVTGRSLKAPGLFSLKFDNVTGARLAAEHLLQLGHRRIAFIAGPAAHPDAVERQRGYRAALEAAGVAFDPALVAAGQFHEESGYVAIEHLLDSRQRFTAVFAANDQSRADGGGRALAGGRRRRRSLTVAAFPLVDEIVEAAVPHWRHLHPDVRSASSAGSTPTTTPR